MVRSSPATVLLLAPLSLLPEEHRTNVTKKFELSWNGVQVLRNRGPRGTGIQQPDCEPSDEPSCEYAC